MPAPTRERFAEDEWRGSASPQSERPRARVPTPASSEAVWQLPPEPPPEPDSEYVVVPIPPPHFCELSLPRQGPTLAVGMDGLQPLRAVTINHHNAGLAGLQDLSIDAPAAANLHDTLFQH